MDVFQLPNSQDVFPRIKAGNATNLDYLVVAIPNRSDRRLLEIVIREVLAAQAERHAVEIERLRTQLTPLQADMLLSLPGGKMDNTTFEQIEEALNKADAPMNAVTGGWMTLAERLTNLIAAKDAEIERLRAALSLCHEHGFKKDHYGAVNAVKATVDGALK